MGKHEKKPITQEYLKTLFEYDGGLYRITARGSARIGQRSHSHGECGYKSIGIDGIYYYEHRLVWLYFNGTFPEIIDHINGDRSDNRIENLRLATRAENNQNAKLKVTNKSGAKGVYWHKQKQMWCAKITYLGKQIFLGFFKDVESASREVSEARKFFHKQFANNGV